MNQTIPLNVFPRIMQEFLLLFVALKLTKYIDWSWWFVLTPLYIPIILFIVLGISHLYFNKGKW